MDLVVPYTITDRLDNGRKLHTMIFVNPAIGWLETIEIPDKTSTRISQVSNNVWLAHYHRPKKITFDNRNKFKKNFLPLLRDFSIKPIPTTIKNPQVNAVLEYVH